MREAKIILKWGVPPISTPTVVGVDPALVDSVLYTKTAWRRTPRDNGKSAAVLGGRRNLCLHIKRPWEDFWYLWPITDTNGYLVDGWTFLTP